AGTGPRRALTARDPGDLGIVAVDRPPHLLAQEARMSYLSVPSSPPARRPWWCPVVPAAPGGGSAA
ncbi:MAG: hypothetical protein ACTINV_01435, partial [Cellulosimicrobium funkei]